MKSVSLLRIHLLTQFGTCFVWDSSYRADKLVSQQKNAGAGLCSSEVGLPRHNLLLGVEKTQWAKSPSASLLAFVLSPSNPTREYATSLSL
ncbi:hypothetical protein YC2023_090631 [Brassica napus]